MIKPDMTHSKYTLIVQLQLSSSLSGSLFLFPRLSLSPRLGTTGKNTSVFVEYLIQLTVGILGEFIHGFYCTASN